MPIEIRELNGNEALELILSGSIGKEDYGETIPIVEGAIAQHGKVSLLMNLCQMEHWEPNTIWEELKFDVKNFRHFAKIAVVGNERWEEWLTKASGYYSCRGSILWLLSERGC
ncbi:MAG: STAS/SEC14 domain-containing protein [Roseibacillus sp.]